MRGLANGAGVAFCALGLFVGYVVAGDTTPPAGPVAGTMKTLDEVEARIPIGPATTPGDSDSTYRIASPGSYYLTSDIQGENLKRGIEIASDDVTIDLNGYTMQGVVGSLQGIATTDIRNNLTIRNGIVRDWGNSGIDLSFGGFGESSLIEHVHASDNGGLGIRATDSAIIRYCTSRLNAIVGISVPAYSVIEHCTAQANQNDGIVAGAGVTIRACNATENLGEGIRTGGVGAVIACTTLSNGGNGINAASVSLVRDCNASSNTLNGILALNDSQILSNQCDGNGDAGIRLSSGDTRVEGNNATDNSVGFAGADFGALFIRNTAAGNATNYSLSTGDRYGPIITLGGGDMSGTTGSERPWANFSY